MLLTVLGTINNSPVQWISHISNSCDETLRYTMYYIINQAVAIQCPPTPRGKDVAQQISRALILIHDSFGWLFISDLSSRPVARIFFKGGHKPSMGGHQFIPSPAPPYFIHPPLFSSLPCSTTPFPPFQICYMHPFPCRRGIPSGVGVWGWGPFPGKIFYIVQCHT